MREFKGNITSEIVEDGAVTIVRISNPEKRNALEPDSYWSIGDAVNEADANPATRCVIVTGDDAAFCSGMDLTVFISGEEEISAGNFTAIEHMVNAITRASVPVVAAAEGAVAGIGASLACACDLIVAGQKTFISLPFGRIGLMPDGGAVATLAASIGRHRTMQLVLRHERIPAADAVSWGLFTEVADNALERALEYAREFRFSPRGALADAKRAVNRASLAQLPLSLAEEARAQTALAHSAEHKEGVKAFLERREVTF
ncbi:enoyl-CoA hydratase-related protein [Corynebacterium genitalium ATCC 33030]|uniref:Enoyl-CoA hydratase/isomerase family protein n=1 Tax=Corynebacterium genitalium ATCC 33030 TaxID=585529 RepID=D7WC41_9CORY|nr:enoyl-CoA hydratase-related protein [Corynebacterium genitalium]EFK54670.1 enoyl-CoA hydratase/isomerase family protein [Corynebacterium genitalium ATCC 33030]UUA89007.1 enoyl-CoA hydratase-related protein [Corynebacterium genitalium ATCC 33030]